MSRIATAVVVAAAFGLLSCSRKPDAAAAPPPPATHTIVIEGMRFQPGNVTVRQGDTVIWVNKDMFAHTATAKPAGFDSQSIDAGKSWSARMQDKGEFAYVCDLHPTMTATLRVN